MDQRNQEGAADTETPGVPAVTGQQTALVAVVMSTTILVMGLLMCFLFLAPEVDHDESTTSAKKLLERLKQCQNEHQDVTHMLHAAIQDSRCRLCPGGWRWWRGHCYFFSVGHREDLQWDESAGFCQMFNSSLLVIKDSAEMDFIQNVMRSFPKSPFLWVGLTDAQQEGQWLWRDGTDIQHYMKLTIEWDSDHRDCADLRGGGSLFAADCDSFGPWVCKKDS